MDKNTLTGLLLMGLVLFGFMLCNRNEQPEQQAESQQAQQANTQKDKDNTDNVKAVNPTEALAATLTNTVRAKGSAEG